MLQERAGSGSVENTLYEGLVELFPESYSSSGFNTADSGKLLVLSDILTSIRQLSPSDRCGRVHLCIYLAFLCIYVLTKNVLLMQGGRSVQLYSDA